MDEERLKKALLDPPAVFEKPAEVLADATLTNEQKVEILRRWEYDASEVSVAEEEGMPANDGQVLQQIMCALRDLVGEIDTERTPPTKQGGLDRRALQPKKRRS